MHVKKDVKHVWKGVKIIWKLCEINLLFTHYFTYVSHVCFWVVWCLRTGLTQPLISSSANCTKTQLHTMSRQEANWPTDFVSEFYSDIYKKSFLYKATRYKILQLKLQLVTEVISHPRPPMIFFLFQITTERLYLIQRQSNMAVKLTRNELNYCHGNIWLTSTKT